jgi:hypothetical protein
MHPHPRHAIKGLYKTAFDCEGSNAGEYVAAIGRDIHLRLFNADLSKQKVDVAVGALGLRHDGDLARERVSAADAVDLARIRRTHNRQEQRIAVRRVGWKIVSQEIGTLGGATPKDHARNARLNGPSPLMWQMRSGEGASGYSMQQMVCLWLLMNFFHARFGLPS